MAACGSVQLRGKANAKSVGDGRLLSGSRGRGYRRGLDARRLEDSTLASSDGSLVSASAPGL
jgi:hypothetical protein